MGFEAAVCHPLWLQNNIGQGSGEGCLLGLQPDRPRLLVGGHVGRPQAGAHRGLLSMGLTYTTSHAQSHARQALATRHAKQGGNCFLLAMLAISAVSKPHTY